RDMAGPGYLRAMGIRLVAGREFNERDETSAPPVMLINEAFAVRYFAGQDPVGKRVKVGRVPHEVVGVYHNYVYRSATNLRRSPDFLVPLAQNYSSSVWIVVRAERDPAPLLPALRDLVAGLNPNLPLMNATTLEENIQTSLFERRMAAWLVSAMGLLAAI